jgi:hypothetical protein
MNNDVKLLSVPINQMLWFRKKYFDIEIKMNQSECFSYSMFESNLFGVNERFINWNSDNMGVIDEYLQNYILQYDKTKFINKLLVYALNESKILEYYEITNNLNLLLTAYDKEVLAYEKDIDDYYRLCNQSDLLF